MATVKNQKGEIREITAINDLWHVGMLLQEQHPKLTLLQTETGSLPGERISIADAVLNVWHDAHDMKRELEEIEAEIKEKADAMAEVNKRRNELFDGVINDDLPDGFTKGYIGNCGCGNDDRGWYVFGPGGTSKGGFSTAERGKLLPIISNILFAHGK
jgi:hypothetical protein